MRIGYLLLGLVLLTLTSCHTKSDREAAIAEIPIAFKIERFERAFAKAKPADLPELKAEYPFLFPKQYPDSLWVAKMQDSIQREINREVRKAFPDLKTQKTGLTHLFQHLSYYFDNFKVPRVITLTSGVDYHNKVIVTDSLVLISLDVYLGANHKFYYGLQRYLADDFIPSQILPDVAEQYAEHYVPAPSSRAFIDYMVYYGKLLYLKERLLPQTPKYSIIGYTAKELTWADNNERQIWGYFIEHKSLYKTDPDLRRDFLDMGPFTKFGLVLDSQSPAQLGQYIGWHIVRQYMANHEDTSLQELLKMDNTTLFKASNYKPKQD